MKFIVLGDIHGNIIALEKVLKLYQNKVDKIICHGDVVNYGPWSNECVELLQASNIQSLKGNHEEAYLMGFYPGENQLVKDFFQATFATFKHLDIIKEYGGSLELDNYHIEHTINNKYYYPDSDFSNLNLTKNIIIGHSHYPFHHVLDNGMTITNTGSIGQNRNDLSIINFALIDQSLNAVTIEAIAYDPMPLIEEMRIRKYPIQCVEYYLKKIKM